MYLAKSFCSFCRKSVAGFVTGERRICNSCSNSPKGILRRVSISIFSEVIEHEHPAAQNVL